MMRINKPSCVHFSRLLSAVVYQRREFFEIGESFLSKDSDLSRRHRQDHRNERIYQS